MAVFYTIISDFFKLWWLWLPPFLIVLSVELWVEYLKVKAAKKIIWLLLEVKIPRIIEKTPKAMEQIFAGLHGTLANIKFLDKYWKGKVQEWFSFEIVGLCGEMHFFIRTPEQFKNLVESQIHSQYPEAEISEVLDYASSLAAKIPSESYSIGGVELILERANFYPIRTYVPFEERQAERRIDPMASFLEIISNLKPDENIFIQYLVAPISEKEKKWKKEREEGTAIINKLTGKKVEIKKSFFESLFEGLGEFLGNLMAAIAVYPEWGAKKEEAKSTVSSPSPSEKLVAEAVGNKISKLAFKVCIRFGYIAEKSIFNKANMNAVSGAFKQFNTVDMNAFKGNSKAGTTADQPRIIPFIKERREYIRKIAFIDRFLNRKMSKNKKDFILNIEELATIYHYPIIIVEAPAIQRVGTRKTEPPVGLPM